jgi:ankyrin repeat protein
MREEEQKKLNQQILETLSNFFKDHVNNNLKETTEKLKTLIESGADINYLYPSNEYDENDELSFGTPIYFTALKGNVDLANALLELNANPNKLSNIGDSPIHVATKNNHGAIVELLVNKGLVDVNSIDSIGYTPLHIASGGKDQIGLVKTLLELNANPNLLSNYGDAPIHIATQENCEDIVKLLVTEGKVDINSLDDTNSTPLHIAYENQNANLIKTLCELKADINIKNNYGKSPLDIAEYKHNKALKEALNESEKGSKMDYFTTEQETVSSHQSRDHDPSRASLEAQFEKMDIDPSNPTPKSKRKMDCHFFQTKEGDSPISPGTSPKKDSDSQNNSERSLKRIKSCISGH